MRPLLFNSTRILLDQAIHDSDSFTAGRKFSFRRKLCLLVAAIALSFGHFLLGLALLVGSE